VGKNLYDYIIPPDIKEQVAHVCKAVASGETIRMETVRQHKDGKIIPVLLTLYAVVVESRLIGIWGIYVDLSERNKTEKILQESENRLRNFAHSVPDMSFVIDEEGRYVEAFGNVEKMLGKSAEEIVDSCIYNLFSHDVAQVFLTIIRETILSGSPKYFIREMEVKEKVIIAEERVVPLSYTVDGKKTVGVVITDITDRQRMERTLYFAYEMARRSDFINGIVLGNNNIDEAAANFAKQLGIDFSNPLFCCLLHSEEYAALGTENAGFHERRKLKESLLDLLGGDADYVVWDCQFDIGVLCQVKTPLAGQGEKELVYQIQEKIYSFIVNFKMVIGVGNIQTGPEGLKRSYRQARSAVVSARCRDKNNKAVTIYYYSELGFLKFLINYSEEKYADEFIEDILGNLITYDQRKGTDLLITLESIVQNFTLQAAAETAFLHPKTIYYRKQRIEKILGYSLDTVDMRLAASMAIKLYKIRNNQ
jgi:PAS domain S-box-containing protein